ncbi:hypothetical protein IFM89_011054 [Coptis chinensis]|uniref:Transposase-associated domain-containing protein n=1 Tax=Coptis chinensis TaxID=261450 RepID=A0A835MAY4_9MAGN|nr:hypothetical protein IFM89_011054 [Coptis chinensis]
MKESVGSDAYLDGIESFLEFMRDSLGKRTWSSCLCAKCCNVRGMVDPKTIFVHLVRYGFDESYTTWYFHGESFVNNVKNFEPFGSSTHNSPEDTHPQEINFVNEELRTVQLDDLDEYVDKISSDEDFNADEISSDEISSDEDVDVKYSAFLLAVLGFLLSVYSLKSIGSDMLRQESTESSKQAEKRARKTMLSREAVMAKDLNGGIHISNSDSRPSLDHHLVISQVSGGGGSCVSSKGKKKVEFDSNGQPIGDGSEGFSSLLGGITKTHCPISYESFKNVPSPTKNIIWSSVVKEYNVDDAYKKINLKKVAKSFREFKHRLRVKYYDKYDNDVDRKRNCPTGVKLEEWENFMDNESKPSRKLMRTKGKVAREAMNALHTSGRRGAARTVHDMKSKNLNVKVTRTDSYMAIHTHKDGSFIAPERMARDPTRSQSHGDSSRGMELCELINMHREVVAKGRATRANIILDATLDTPMDIYNVRVLTDSDMLGRIPDLFHDLRLWNPRLNEAELKFLAALLKKAIALKEILVKTTRTDSSYRKKLPRFHKKLLALPRASVIATISISVS